MKIETNRDYWKEYYLLRKLIETGKSHEFDLSDQLYSLAIAQGKIVTQNWKVLGLKNN